MIETRWMPVSACLFGLNRLTALWFLVALEGAMRLLSVGMLTGVVATLFVLQACAGSPVSDPNASPTDDVAADVSAGADGSQAGDADSGAGLDVQDTVGQSDVLAPDASPVDGVDGCAGTGCGDGQDADGTNGVDGLASQDSQAPDTATPDSVVSDAGAADAGVLDAEAPDTTSPDGAMADAAPFDANADDAITTDSVLADSEAPDVGTADSQTVDAETPDAGSSDASSVDADQPDAAPLVCGTMTCSDGQHCATCGNASICADADMEACCTGTSWSVLGVDLYDPAKQSCCDRPDSNGKTLTCNKVDTICLGAVAGTSDACVPIGSTTCGSDKICDPTSECAMCDANSACVPKGNLPCCVGQAWSSLGVDDYNPSLQTCCDRPDSNGKTLKCNKADSICIGAVAGTSDTCAPIGSTTCGADKICGPTEDCLTCGQGDSVCAPKGYAPCCTGTPWSVLGVDVYDPVKQTCCGLPGTNGKTLTCNLNDSICLGPTGGSFDGCVPIGSFTCGSDKVCDPTNDCAMCGNNSACVNKGDLACCVGSPWSVLGVDAYNPTKQACCDRPDSNGKTLLCDISTSICIGPVAGTSDTCAPIGSFTCGTDKVCGPDEECLTCGQGESVCAPKGHKACCNGTPWSILGVDTYDPAKQTCCNSPASSGQTLLCDYPSSICLGPASVTYQGCVAPGSFQCGQDQVCVPGQACYQCAGYPAGCSDEGLAICCSGSDSGTVYNPAKAHCCGGPAYDGSPFGSGSLTCLLSQACVWVDQVAGDGSHVTGYTCQ